MNCLGRVILMMLDVGMSYDGWMVKVYVALAFTVKEEGVRVTERSGT